MDRTVERILDLRRDTDFPLLLLNRSTNTGSAHGWTIEAQRRQVTVADENFTGESQTYCLLCVRVTDPHGRVLHIVNNHGDMGVAKGAVGTLLGKPAALLLAANPTAEQLEQAVVSLDRIFVVAWEQAGMLLQDRLSSHLMKEKILCANYSYSYDAIISLRDNYCLSEQYLSDVGGGIFPDHRTAPVGFCGNLIDAGMTLEEGFTWFYVYERKNLASAKIRRVVKFKNAGWTSQELSDFTNFLNSQPSASWSKLSAEKAYLAAEAGLSCAEAVRLEQRGEFDVDMLSMLGALQSDTFCLAAA